MASFPYFTYGRGIRIPTNEISYECEHILLPDRKLGLCHVFTLFIDLQNCKWKHWDNIRTSVPCQDCVLVAKL